MNLKLVPLLILFPFSSWALNCSFQSNSELAQDVLNELNQVAASCTKQPVHLTFDDGPASWVTPKLLEELKTRNVKASFFVTTTNLEPNHRNYSQNVALVRQAMSEGHLIANHGHEHKAYDVRLDANGSVLEAGLSQSEKEAQISRSVALLNAATGNKFSSQKPMFFRFPYGRGAMPSARELEYMEKQGTIRLSSPDYAGKLREYRYQSSALQTVSGAGYSHLGWNHDSGDSSFGSGMPERAQLKEYIIKNITSMCNSRVPVVGLFHDIKLMNTAAIPAIVDIGQCLGMKFISAQQMLEHRAVLEDRGVLLTRQSIAQGPVKNLDALMQTLNAKSRGEPDCPPEGQKGCFSEQLKRSFNECEGSASVCFGGKWHSRQDPMVIMNCNITD